MCIRTTAIFESGVLRPTQPIALDEGTQVEVTIVSQVDEGNQSPAEILAKIAAMSSEGSQSEAFSGSEHNAVLYGKHLV